MLSLATLLTILFFIVIFSILFEIFIRNIYIVAGIVLLVSLLIFVIAALPTSFIVWIIIYTLTALLAAFATCRLIKKFCRCFF